MGRDRFDEFPRVAEATATLQQRRGSLWHAYHRSWATARKHLPMADVAAAGGWRAVATLLRCYQQPDDATLLAVRREGRKLREGSEPPR